MVSDTRTALLDAAQDRMSTEGFAGTSIRTLAAAVGIRESSVYKHFPSKQAILDAVLARADERIAAVAERFGTPIDDPASSAAVYDAISPARLGEIAEGFLYLWLRDDDVIAVRRLLTLEQFRTPAAGELLRALLVDRPRAFQVPLFAELIRVGHLRSADPEAVFLAFWGPILAILAAADSSGDAAEARRLLHVHLAHFRQTHLAPTTDPEEST